DPEGEGQQLLPQGLPRAEGTGEHGLAQALGDELAQGDRAVRAGPVAGHGLTDRLLSVAVHTLTPSAGARHLDVPVGDRAGVYPCIPVSLYPGIPNTEHGRGR